MAVALKKALQGLIYVSCYLHLVCGDGLSAASSGEACPNRLVNDQKTMGFCPAACSKFTVASSSSSLLKPITCSCAVSVSHLELLQAV